VLEACEPSRRSIEVGDLHGTSELHRQVGDVAPVEAKASPKHEDDILVEVVLELLVKYRIRARSGEE